MKQQPRSVAPEELTKAELAASERRAPERRPTTEELMAMPTEDFEAWWRSVGGKTASDLGISER